MLYRMETKSGQISMDRDVVAHIVEEQVRPFRGKVWISNHKGNVPGFMNRLTAWDERDDLDISMDEQGLWIRIYLVIRFGVSIRMVTEQLISDIRRSLEEYTELPVKEVSIVVTGTLSKHIARRNIEIKG